MLALAGISASAFAQTSTYVDFCAASATKAIDPLEPTTTMLWERKEHDCGNSLNQTLIKIYEEVPKHSQSNLGAMAKGNVRISNQMISVMEGQLLKSKLFKDGNGLETMRCITGMTITKTDYLQNNIDYFAQVLYQLRFLKAAQADKYYQGPRQFKMEIISSKSQLESIINDPTKIGMVINLKGGHLFGSYLDISSDMLGSNEYEKKVMRNIDRLKGSIPLVDNTNEFLDFPIFSVSFSNWYKDGICGKVRAYTEAVEKLIGKQDDLDTGMSALGQKVVKRLLGNTEGRRILIDVSGMSKDSRAWYYEYLKQQRYQGDTIPVIASHVSISGLNWESPEYNAPDNATKNNGSYLNNYKGSMARQDLQSIYESKGIVAISLDKQKLVQGTIFEGELNKTLAGSSERRDLLTKIIVANICKVIHVVQRQDAWDMIAIGSEFDGISTPFDACKSSEDFKVLAKDLLDYFKNPTDIPGVLSAKDIKKYMYDFSADEIVNKIMFENALNFYRRNLDKTSSKRSNESVNGN